MSTSYIYILFYDIASTSFDGPATTDAALAALAAEAGLIDPEPQKDVSKSTAETGDSGEKLSETESAPEPASNQESGSASQLEATTGLLGGGRYQKLSLKGGGSRIPPKGFR